MSGFTPMYDLVLVEREQAVEKIGSIILPEPSKEKPSQGTVVACGVGKLLPDGTIKEMQVHKGDKILFGKFNGTEVTIQGKQYVIVKESEILGTIKE